MKQTDRILHWFEDHDKLSRFQALKELGIFELSARICDLERKGFMFIKIKKTRMNKYGKFTYTEYQLVNGGV